MYGIASHDWKFCWYIILHSTLCTPHSTLNTPHTTLHTLPSTLHTLRFTLHTLHFTLHTLHSTHVNSTLYTPHSTLCTLHFTRHTLHFILRTPQSPLCTLHTTLSLHPPINTPLSSHPSLQRTGMVTLVHKTVLRDKTVQDCSNHLFHKSALRDSMRVRGLHLVFGAGCFAPLTPHPRSCGP